MRVYQFRHFGKGEILHRGRKYNGWTCDVRVKSYRPTPRTFPEMVTHDLTGFTRMNDHSTVDVVPHILDVLASTKDVQVLVGCDSHNRAHHTVYTTTVVLRFKRNGAQVIYRREKAPKVTDLWTRLWGEVERSLAVACCLRDQGQVPVHGIDMDLNSDARFRSNRLHTAAVGYIRSNGYEPHTKPELLPASWAANVLCNQGS